MYDNFDATTNIEMQIQILLWQHSVNANFSFTIYTAWNFNNCTAKARHRMLFQAKNFQPRKVCPGHELWFIFRIQRKSTFFCFSGSRSTYPLLYTVIIAKWRLLFRLGRRVEEPFPNSVNGGASLCTSTYSTQKLSSLNNANSL